MRSSEEIIVFLWGALTSQIARHLDIKLLRGPIGHCLLMHMEPARELATERYFPRKSKDTQLEF